MMTAQEIRQSFKTYFENKNHTIVPSAPLIIKNDPTLMFTNAGMNQFKNVILGNIPIQYNRMANSQKCLRVSGKHNDIEEIGYDTYHHTMFEMLGNWSFGDYFKKEAIEYAWEYLTKVAKLDKNRLYVTVFNGNKDDNLSIDSESIGYWGKYLHKERIIKGNKKDNFWEMGDIGPCGPCSEIHIDIRNNRERSKINALNLINKNHPQVIEIWNLVFMQFNRKANGSLENLPNKVIDTGMGLERLCMAIQGKTSTYDTDLFQPIIHSIEKITGLNYNQNIKTSIAIRVISDHIRSIALSIADGQLPSNEGAGYVIRRILRRATRYAYTFLGAKRSFIYQLLPSLIDSIGDAYQEIIAQKKIIEQVIKEEEESFLRTLGKGVQLLDKTILNAKKNNKNIIEGTDVFILSDTYGFPVDLTELILREHNMTIDKKAFNLALDKQRERAKNATKIKAEDWKILKNGKNQFIGYDKTKVQTQIIRYRNVINKNTNYYQIVLETTPFFAEMGGQVGDIGRLIDVEGISIDIINTKQENGLIIHFTKKLPKCLNGLFYAEVDLKSRRSIECNHTATHLLHEALRAILGTHVIQKGSYISPNILRFDFSHFKKLTKEEIRKIEKIITNKIRQNLFLEENRKASTKEAYNIGALALFKEKYKEEVRIIKFGSSIELCGGTHVNSTGEIGSFRIINESSIAAGIRRIEAITAERVEDFFYNQQDIFLKIKTILNNTSDIYASIKKMIDKNTTLNKQVEEFLNEKILTIKKQLINNKQLTSEGINLFVLEGSFIPKVVKNIAFQLKGEYKEKYFFVSATYYNMKPFLMVLLSCDLVKNGFNAVQIIQKATDMIKGKGGGKPPFATAEGKDLIHLPQALNYIVNTYVNIA